jgi:trans-aconitate 3-methyltransferase
MISLTLSSQFSRVIGIDPSPIMIQNASSTSSLPSNLTFLVRSADDLKFIDDETVDLVVSGTAAQYFPHPDWYVEVSRVLRKGGTLAVWTYSGGYLLSMTSSLINTSHHDETDNWQFFQLISNRS